MRRALYAVRVAFWVWWYWDCDVESARAVGDSLALDYHDSGLPPKAVALGFRRW